MYDCINFLDGIETKWVLDKPIADCKCAKSNKDVSNWQRNGQISAGSCSIKLL